MQNKNQERFATFQIGVPQSGGANVAIADGSVVIFGTGTKAIVGVAAYGTATTPQNYNPSDSYLVIDCEGVFNLSVSAFVSKSPSSGAAITPGQAIYADGGTYDKTTGVTYGSSLDCDTNGTFVGLSMDSLAAGATGVIRVILKNSPCA